MAKELSKLLRGQLDIHDLTGKEKRLLQAKVDYYLGKKVWPSMSDREYDMLEKEIQKSIPDSSVLGVGVTTNLKTIKTEKLPYPLISLANAYGDKGLNPLLKWQSSTDKIGIGKYDGNSIEVVYDKGVRSQAFTRYDKVRGRDISEKLKYFTNLPKRIKYKGRLVIAFEAELPNHIFNIIAPMIYDKGENIEQKNPRNLLSGWFNKIHKVDTGYLGLVQFVALAIKNTDEWLRGRYTKCPIKPKKSAMLDWLRGQGFRIPVFAVLKEKLTDKYLLSVFKSVRGRDPKLEMDGLVVEVDSIKEYERLGYKGNSQIPKGAIAWKVGKEKKTTVIIKHIRRMTRTGTLTIKAVLNPVTLVKTKVRHVTLHNYCKVIERGLGIGAEVEMVKGGDIIPHIENVLVGVKPKIPTKCPSCGGKLTWDKYKTNLMCLNSKNCPAQISDALEHFIVQLGIQGWRKNKLEKLINAGINTPRKILKVKRNHLEGIEGIKEKSVTNLLTQIEKLKNTPVSMAKLYYALNVAKGFGTNIYGLVLDALGHNAVNKTVSDPEKIQGILVFTKGLSTLRIDEWFEAAPKLRLELLYLRDLIKIAKPIVKGDVLKGMKFVFTRFRDKEMAELIKNNGGKVVATVSKNVHCVFYGLGNSKKADRGRALELEMVNKHIARTYIEKLIKRRR